MRETIQEPPKEELDLVYICDVKSKPIDWLWPGYLAKGKLSLVVGHPGQGKSTLTASIAAIVSSGGVWPVSEAPVPAGDVVILSAEDDIADTLRPRLEAAGADIKRVRVLKGVKRASRTHSFSLVKDIERLRGLSADLLIIDPISSYLDGIDTHKNAEVRSTLEPLCLMAEQQNMAILGVSHLNKAEKLDTISRVSGSMAFVAVARAVHIVLPDESVAERRFFHPIKNNIGPDGQGLAFSIEPRCLDNDIQTSTVVWESEYVAKPTGLGGHASVRSALEKAKDFLFQLLREKPYSVNEVLALAEQAGHSKATIRRAADALNIGKGKVGMEGGWVWSLPGNLPEDAQDDHASLMSTFEDDDHLRDALEQGRLDG